MNSGSDGQAVPMLGYGGQVNDGQTGGMRRQIPSKGRHYQSNHQLPAMKPNEPFSSGGKMPKIRNIPNIASRTAQQVVYGQVRQNEGRR